MNNLFIWDFHGTLEVGTIFVLTEIANTLLQEAGSSEKYTPAQFATIPSFSWNTFFREHLPLLSQSDVEKIAKSAYDEKRFGSLMEKYSRANDDALEVMRCIKNNSGINVVVSHSRQDKLGYYIDHIGLTDVVTEYYGVDDGTITSRDDVVLKKQKIISSVFRRFPHLKHYAVGDAEMDYLSATAAGADTFFWLIHVNNKGAKQLRFKDVPEDTLRFILRLSEIADTLPICSI